MVIPYAKISELAGHIRQAKRVSFITGAGASRAAGIPPAAGLVEIITRDYPHCLTTLPLTERTNYGPVMARLSPADREKLIQPLLDNARFNWGQVALAGMMQNRTVQRVLTFNFDLVLERAAALIGLQVPIYDFGVAPTNDINRVAPSAIIHLHGQSFGLVLLNTDAETERHATALRPMLHDTLCNGLTVVIGYSGAADGAFRVMADCYNSYHRLIWLGYSDDPPPHLRPLLDKDYAEYVGGCDFDRVMIALAKELGHWPPMIFRNPMEHVLAGLSDVIDFPVADETGDDVLTPTRARLTSFSGRWVAEGGPEDTAAQSLISGTAEDPRPAGDAPMSDFERRMAAWREVAEADRLAETAKGLQGAEAAKAFAEAGQRYARAVEIKPDMHEAFNNWGTALIAEGRTLQGDVARAKFAEAGQKYARAVEIKPDMHEAFYNWGSALLNTAHLVTGPERDAVLAEAEAKLQLLQDISGKTNFNLACVDAMRGQAGAAVAALRDCLRDGTLPDAAQLDADRDLDLIRGDAGYLAFRAGLA